MAFAYNIDPLLGLVRLDPGQDLPSVSDFEGAIDRLASDPLFRAGFGVLVERRQFQVEPAVGYVRGAIDALASRRGSFGDTRWSSITSHLTSYGMGRMAEAFAENRGVKYRVFMDEREAIMWLLEGS
jgi:hypothetical protein